MEHTIHTIKLLQLCFYVRNGNHIYIVIRFILQVINIIKKIMFSFLIINPIFQSKSYMTLDPNNHYLRTVNEI